MADAVYGFAVGQAKVTLCALRRRNTWFLVDTDAHCLLRRIQIETDHVGGSSSCFSTRLSVSSVCMFGSPDRGVSDSSAIRL